jgi:uncharacterized membrane protein
MWKWFALGSAFFAALTAILGKIGVQGVPSNLATAIRTVVILVLAWGLVFTRGESAALLDFLDIIGHRHRIVVVVLFSRVARC